MFAIEIEKSKFDAWAKRLPRRHEYAMYTALRAEGLRLAKRAWVRYACSEGHGRFRPYAPVTIALRKGWRGVGKGYGQWMKGLGRYWVDRESLTAYIGVLGRDKFKAAPKLQPLSKQFAQSARLHARGYAVFISRKVQRRIAARLQRKYMGYKRASKRAEFHRMVPKVGWHYVKRRPVAPVVARRERRKSIRNVMRIYVTKMMGERYGRTWMEDWGNMSVGYNQSPFDSFMEMVE